MSDNELTELIERGVREYKTAIDAGMNNDEAKAYAYSEVHGLWEALSGQMSNMARWANALKKIVQTESERACATEENKNGVTPSSVPGKRAAMGAMAFARYMFTRWAERENPDVGDRFTFSLRQWADAYQLMTGKSQSYNAFMNEFYPSQLRSSITQKNGWSFDCDGSNSDAASITVTAKPAAKVVRTYTESEVAAMLKDATAEAARAAAETVMRKFSARTKE